MMATIQIPREKCEFVTEEGRLAFIALFPGEARASMSNANKSYKAEIWLDPTKLRQDSPMIQAISLVAQTFDQSGNITRADGMQAPGWSKHLYGPKGKLRYLHETERDSNKYPQYENQLIASFSSTYSLKSLKLEGLDLSSSEGRAKYDMAINSKAPGAYKFANPNVQADLVKVERQNEERKLRGQAYIPEDKYHEVLLPVEPHEIWSGCYGRVSGRAYWSDNGLRPGVNLSFSHVLLTRTGERLYAGEASPDAAFSGFAPSADLAPGGAMLPPPPAPPANGVASWANLV